MSTSRKLNKNEKEIVEMISKLEPQEFVGVCKILNIPLCEDYKPDDEEKVILRPAEKLLEDVVVKICNLNRVQRRNLKKLLKPAVKGR
jgi:hypothetical protein